MPAVASGRRAQRSLSSSAAARRKSSFSTTSVTSPIPRSKTDAQLEERRLHLGGSRSARRGRGRSARGARRPPVRRAAGRASHGALGTGASRSLAAGSVARRASRRGRRRRGHLQRVPMRHATVRTTGRPDQAVPPPIDAPCGWRANERGPPRRGPPATARRCATPVRWPPRGTASTSCRRRAASAASFLPGWLAITIGRDIWTWRPLAGPEARARAVPRAAMAALRPCASSRATCGPRGGRGGPVATRTVTTPSRSPRGAPPSR